MNSIRKFFTLVDERLQRFADSAAPESVIIRDEEGEIDLVSTTVATYMARGCGAMWFC